MSKRANIGPYTTFDEIFTYLKCPARLYLKLMNYKSEIKRKYTSPSVSPVALGREGEELIERGFKKELAISIPRLTEETIKPSRDKLEEVLNKVSNVISNRIRKQLLRIQDIKVKYLPIIVSKEAKKLKKEFGVRAIISKVGFTTIPHHRVGEVDFIGLKEDREVIVIEVKNKQEKLNEKDRLQLEYYIDGLPKQYHYMKFYSHLYEVASQLYSEKYKDHIKLARIVDILQEEIQNSRDIVEDMIMELDETEIKKFLSIYKPKNRDISEYENKESLLELEEFNSDYLQMLGSCEKFLTTIPEYVRLKKTLNHYNKKMLFSIKEFKSSIDFIVELMERGVKNGLLVDIRRSKIIEVSKTTNFDELVKGVWQVKKSAFYGNKIAPKRNEACKYCNFKNACKKVLRDEELEECKSVTSIVHKGFKKLNLNVSKPSFGIPWFNENGIPELKYLQPVINTELSIEELLRQVLNKTEWKYSSIFARKRGWKQLYADAIVSNKLRKEFSFWGL